MDNLWPVLNYTDSSFCYVLQHVWSIYPLSDSLSSPISHLHLPTELCINPQPHHSLNLPFSANNDFPHFFARATPTCLSRYRIPSLIRVVPTAQVRLAHYPFSHEAFSQPWRTNLSQWCVMSGDLCISPIKPWTPVHLYPWCPGPHLVWRKYSMHVCWAKVLCLANEALKIRAMIYLGRPYHVSCIHFPSGIGHGEDSVSFPIESM